LLNETTGAFDGARIHDLHITSQTCNTLRPADPWVINFIITCIMSELHCS